MTSNPSIFEQAILGSPDYDERLAELTNDGADVQAIYEDLAIADVQGAADVLRPVWERTGGVDGYVSLEVAPGLARDTEGTLAMARDYWARVDRPNVMIKIPGTPEGVGAIRAAIADGININVTLLFSLDAWASIAEAWLSGLEDRAAAGKPVDGIASVASFFVSRVDTAVDKRLKALGSRRAVRHGRGRQRPARLRALAAAGGRRALRGAAGEGRAGRSGCCGPPPARRTRATPTSSTSPSWPAPRPSTRCRSRRCSPTRITASRSSRTLPDAAPAAHAAIAAIEAAGVSMDEVTDELLEAGIVAFAKAMDTLLAGIEQRRAAVLAGEPASIEAHLTDAQARAIGARAAWGCEQNVLRRVWSKDDSLWGPGDDKPSERLGWLTIAEQSLEHLDDVLAFVEEVRADGFTDCALLGMGGSSLAPEVFRQTFGTADGYLRLHVLDSTHPDAVAALQSALPLDRTLFLVSSKSGGTLEPRSMHAHFHALVPDGRQWAAVTDPGTKLEALAQEQGFRHVFHGAPDIGGRYSALSRVRRRAGGADRRRRARAAGAGRGRRARRRPVAGAGRRAGAVARARARRAGDRRPRQAHARDRRAARARPVCGSSSSSPRAPASTARGSSRSPTSRSASRPSTATTASSCTCRTPEARATPSAAAGSTRSPTPAIR